MGALSEKVAVITGGSSGIGLSAAKLFVEEGAEVMIVARREKSLREALEVLGSSATGLIGDVSDLSLHDRLARAVRDRYGSIDIYMANAGINTITNSADVSVDEYDAQFATNTRGVFFGVQKARPLLRPGGSIILTGSIASQKMLDGHAVYGGSKAAIEVFMKIWALELKSRSIRVNMISPGPTDTSILDKLGIPPNERDAFRQATAGVIPLGRLGRPDEIARAALFLASDASSFITGVNLPVDGGMSLV